MDTHFHRSKPNTDASVTLPSSKSLSHRALITASLADGDSLIHGISESKDTEATMNVLSHLGVQFERIQESLHMMVLLWIVMNLEVHCDF